MKGGDGMNKVCVGGEYELVKGMKVFGGVNKVVNKG